MKKIEEAGELNPFFKSPEAFMGLEVEFKAILYRLKDLGNFSFLHIRTPLSYIQCVYKGEVGELREGCSVRITGVVAEAKLKDPVLYPNNLEVVVKSLEVLSTPYEAMPIDLTKKKLNINNDVKFDLRMLSMRHPLERAVFKIQEGLVHGFRKYFTEQACTEIRTPKIVKEGAEGGANIFEIGYFGQKAFLTQSPQFYKEFCIGVFDRVFEIAPVFRAEKHNTNRHINEYSSIDVELGHIESFYNVMAFEVAAIRTAFSYLRENYRYELQLLEVELADFTSIPSLKFSEVKVILNREYNIGAIEVADLSPVEEVKICEYILKETGSEFVFVTHYPTEKRPFYAKDSEENPTETLSFDLLYRGVEITTGGQRIHDYIELVEKMERRGMIANDFEFFSVAHKHGLAPHGGFGMGLERLTQKVIGLESVKLATMFPRDTKRLTP